MRLLTGLATCSALCLALVCARGEDLAAKSSRGRELMAAGRFEEAIPIYRELVRALPNNPGPIMNLGLALHMSGQERESIAQFQAVLRLDPNHEPARLFLGAAHLALKEPARAIAPLQTVVRAQPDNEEARLMLAQAYFALERYEQAAKQFERLSKLDVENPKDWNGMGLSYEGLAGRNFEGLQKVALDSAYWLALVAESFAKASQFNRAFLLYREALSKMPGMRGVRKAVADIYRKTGHPDWAATEEDKERSIPPLDCSDGQRSSPATSGAFRKESDLHLHMECHFWAGRYREVLSTSEGAKSTEARYWRTRAYNELARQAFGRLAQLTPSAEVHELLAKIHFTRRNYVESIKEWEEALKLSPGNSYFRQRLGISLSAIGDYDAALPILRNGIKQSPGSADLNYYLGFTLLQMEKAKEAIPFLAMAVSIDPTALPAQRELARAYLRLAQVEKAMPHLNAALPIDKDGTLYYQLAQAYRQTGQKELEKRMLEKFKKTQTSRGIERETLEQEIQITPP